MNGLLAFCGRPNFYPRIKTMRQMEKSITSDRPNVVGVIHTTGGFLEAGISGLDAVEVRVDALRDSPSLRQIAELPVAAIVTVRRPDEGGTRAMSDEERVASYFALLPSASAIDLELRSAERMRDLVEAVRREEKTLILSSHDFAGTPPLSHLQETCAKMRGLGADIVKIATRTETLGEVATLLALLEGSSAPLAVMGMGALGRASRLLFAKAGSALNYGWLDKPQVAGQWSAKEFIELLART
jgi:3-dehydroquinate dehydratase I